MRTRDSEDRVGRGGARDEGAGHRWAVEVRRAALVALLLLGSPLSSWGGGLRAQDGPPPAVRETVSRVLALFASRGEAPLLRFADEVVAPSYRASFEDDAFLRHLESVREAGRGRSGDVAVRPRPDGALDLTVAGGARFVLALDETARVTRLDIGDPGGPIGFGPGEEDAAVEPVTWEELEARLAAEEADGFAGVVRVRRGGEVMLSRAYGPADRSTGRPNTLDVAFGIGSTPIDFTVAATRMLAARGVLRLDAPVAEYLDGVPADKQGLTLTHILEGRSGLPDFHDTADDWDPDLAWIDRDTAVRRILAQPLLFEPGSSDAHSHSAYVLLAALIEAVTGQPYTRFVRSEILDPLGMGRTGFYGEDLGLDVEDFAVGYGVDSVGLPNIPPNWGPTSWLVMGSGGMFSTLDDLDRFYRALAQGSLPGLEPGWPGGDVAYTGGSDRGYFMLMARNRRGDSVLLLSNHDRPGAGATRVARALADLVLDR
jgi:CubicO group peptidase (beta-lactamase class C family)